MDDTTKLHHVKKTYTKKDFASDQAIRWCPGCGDYAVLSAMLNALPQLNIPREKFAFISGIGCAARFPYYLHTYGFHTIHGRGPAVATGVKLANPDLSVWEIQGDGDALAIGGNHFIHAIRRNINFNMLVFNNEIYGLTKGQYSPTSNRGLVTKSTPYGTIDRPFSVADLALGAGATYYARTVDTQPKHMTQIFVNAEQHKGTSVIEILQNCVIFNDQVHAAVTSKATKDNYQLHLEHGSPMLFGERKQKGIRLKGLDLEVVMLDSKNVSLDDILVHDAHNKDVTLHAMLARLCPPHFPMAFGVIRDVSEPTYGALLHDRVEALPPSPDTLDKLFRTGETWEVI